MKFTIRTFYGIGVILMFIAILGSILNLAMIWHMLTIGAIISNIFGGIFLQMLFMGLFYFLYRTAPAPSVNSMPDLDALLKEIEKKEVNKSVKKEKKV